MTDREKLIELLHNPDMPIDCEWTESISAQYPFFTLPVELALTRSNALSPEQKKTYMQQIALNAGDRDTLFRLTDHDSSQWDNFYPQEESQSTVSTVAAIDTFLDKYGNINPQEEEILNKLIFNPTPDYAQLLSEEEEKSLPDLSEPPADEQDALINAFILKSKEQQGHFPSSSLDQDKQPLTADDTPISTPETTDSSLLSESLAKIYIKQHKYSKAYEIIHNLSLNFPEKSIYFADQLRFLRKLIIIQQYSNK